MSATMRLERGMPFAVGDRRRVWEVLLDDVPVGGVALKDSLELLIDPGRHTLQLTSTGGRRSPQRSFEAADESMVNFTCHPQPIWPLLLMALVVPGRWIVLKQR